MDKELSIIKAGFVAVADNKILAIGPEADMKEKYRAEEIIEAGNSILLPGMINTHTHAAMSYFRGLADDLPLSDWLTKHIWPAEAKFVNPDFVKKASELAVLEMIKAGITGFNDMYFFEEVTADVARQAGIRAVVGEGILDFPSPSAKTPAEAIKKTAELISEFKDEELIKVAFAPHSVYACSQEPLVKIKELAEKYNTLIHIHISETKKEVDDCQEKHACSPVEYLDSLDFLSPRVIAAHSVWLSDRDLEIYEKRGVKVSHNPISNAKLASGIAPITEMIKRGINVGLGTDGAASNNTLDIFSEMRACALLHKVNNSDPAAMSAREVVKMATIGGAEVLGLGDKIGSLETGKRADFITINLDKPHLTPLYDPYSHLVYCANASDVDNVIINGKIIMRDRVVKTMDEEKILADANKFRIDI